MATLFPKRGFTLVEIMISTAIIGLLAAIAVPSMYQANLKTRGNRIARELKVAGQAFMQYAFETGNYPGDKLPGQMPDGMAPYLANMAWMKKTAIGGNWDWDYGQFGVKAAVSVKSPDWKDDRMVAIDRTIDDGNLATGQFRMRSGGYMFILEE
jgi:prepilin-type N-terminal cleavage/methylation domain-containing protein